MSDRLEDFVRTSREQFNDKEPPSDLWSKIEGDLTEKPSKSFFLSPFWRVAAAVFVIAVTGWFAYVSTSTQSDAIAQNSEFRDIEEYYFTLISYKRTEINQYISGHEEFANSFTKDIERLDQLYNELKTEMETLDDNQQIIDAMILNLQLRVDILNQQIMILEKIKDQQQEDETTIL